MKWGCIVIMVLSSAGLLKAQCDVSYAVSDNTLLLGEFGQSFESPCTGRIQSVSFDAAAATGALTGTLSMFEGDGVSGMASYTQSLSLSISLGNNTIMLDEPFEVVIKNQYTFEIDFGAPSVSISYDENGSFTPGQMYVSGAATTTDDMVFTVSTTEVFPAGVSTNLALWLRADLNTNTTTNGAAVTTWNDLSRSENNYSGAGTNSVYNDNFINEQPSITFNSNSAVLSTTEVTYTDGTLYVVVNHSDNSGSNNFFGNIASGDDILKFEQLTDSDNYGYTQTSGTDFNSSLTSSHGLTKLLSVETEIGTSTMNIQDIIAGIRRSDNFNVTATNQALSIQDIGGFSDIAEIILYGGGVNSSTERQQLESYLSIKYGLPYDQNLLASDLSTIWDITASPAFNNDVAVIGRDDTQSLNLKKSKTSSSDGVVTVEKTDVYSGDLSFLAWGNNNISLSSANTSDVDGLIIQARMDRVWKITETGDAGNVDVTFDLTQVPGPKSQLDLRVLIDRDGDGFADNDVNPTLATGTLSGQEFTVASVNFQDGDFFTVGSTNAASTPLPIELVYFEARQLDNVIELTWQTAQEINNNFFTIEKSTNGIKWDLLLTQPGAGDSNEHINYSALDPDPYEPNTYYRLKQTDFDGAFSYSDIITVALSGSTARVYPNPVGGLLKISNLNENSSIVIRNVSGKILYSSVPSGKNFMEMPVGGLRPGVYLLQLQSASAEYQMRFIKR